MQFYFGIVVLLSIAIFESLSLIHFVALHNTTLYYFLFYVRCQDMCLHVYGVATVPVGPLPMQSAVYLYINNLSSKITTQNRYSINVTFLDCEYNWIKNVINDTKKFFLLDDVEIA